MAASETHENPEQADFQNRLVRFRNTQIALCLLATAIEKGDLDYARHLLSDELGVTPRALADARAQMIRALGFPHEPA